MKNKYFPLFIFTAILLHVGAFALIQQSPPQNPPEIPKERFDFSDLSPLGQYHPKPERLRKPASYTINPQERVYPYGRCYSRYGEIIPYGDKRFKDCISESNEFDHQGGRTSKSMGLLFIIPN